MTDTAPKDKMLVKIQALLDKAARTDFDEEAQLFLEKADELMVKYQIEMFEVDQAAKRRGSKGREPEVRTVMNNVRLGDLRGPVASMTYSLAHLNGLIVTEFYYGEIRVAGWPEDIDYFEMVLTKLILALVSNMDPKYDPDKDIPENVFRMKSAGLGWPEIWRRIKGDDVPVNRSECIKWSKWHKEYCERTGQPRVTVSQKRGFREDYAYGFTTRVTTRIQSIINKREEDSGAGLVLANRKSDLQQWFESMGFETFAQRVARETKGKKLPATKYSQRKFNHTAHRMGTEAGDRADIGLTGVES